MPINVDEQAQNDDTEDGSLHRPGVSLMLRLAMPCAWLRASESDDDAGGELGLPYHARVQRKQADAGHAGDGASSGIDERREDASVQAQSEVLRGKEFGAASAAQREANLGVVLARVAGQAKQDGHERPHRAVVELLKPSALPMIDRDPLWDRDSEGRRRDQDIRILMREQRLELGAIRDRDVENAAKRHGAVQIHRPAGEQLEEVAAKAVAANGRDFNALCRNAQRRCQARDERRGRGDSGMVAGQDLDSDVESHY